eukprot:15742262-Heterocapsa_arctica.AAC.1
MSSFDRQYPKPAVQSPTPSSVAGQNTRPTPSPDKTPWRSLVPILFAIYRIRAPTTQSLTPYAVSGRPTAQNFTPYAVAGQGPHGGR